MAQIAARGGGTPFGSDVVTVAELLSRNPRSQTAIPVGDLLRREGRVSNARVVDDDAGAALTARVHARRVSGRRGAIAAGSLLAAGSVVGAAVVNNILNAPVTVNEQALPYSTPVQDESPAQVPLQAATAPLATLGQGTHATPLDAGTSAPRSWMNVAFPDTVHTPAPAAASGTGGSRSGSATTGRTGAGATAPQSTTQGSGTQGSTSQGSTAGSSTPAAQNSGSASAPAKSVTIQKPATGDSVTGILGGTIASIGSGTPLSPVTNTVGGVVTGLGEALGGLLYGGTAK